MALICKQLRPIDIPAQESVCKGPNLHRCHIRQCVAEDPGLMHRVKKVAFRTRLQSGMSHRVYNHHFFTRNNSCLDLSRQCHAPRLKNECRPLFSSPNQNQTSCPCWYTRSAFQSIPSFFLHFRPEGCLLDYRGAVRINDVLRLNIQIHDRIDLDGQR